MKEEYIPECFKKPVLVLGCGNILFGDDGFGPAVAERLIRDGGLPAGARDSSRASGASIVPGPWGAGGAVPDEVYVMDAGTGVRDILFTAILGEKKPRHVIVVDAIDAGRQPGELFEIDIDQIPANKIADFSLHQIPTSNMLKELKDLCGVDVTILVCQTGKIPPEVCPGLSREVEAAIPKACALVAEKVRGMGKHA